MKTINYNGVKITYNDFNMEFDKGLNAYLVTLLFNGLKAAKIYVEKDEISFL